MKRIIEVHRKQFKTKLNGFHFANFIILTCAFIIPFLTGSFTNDTKKEELSNYIAERVKNNTRNKNTMAITVSTTPESGALPKDESEFHTLYGIFRQENITFASGFNVNKGINISIPDLKNNINYSIFYNGQDATIKYNGHYKHWYYPIEYMFEAQRLYDISRFMIYLTQSQADVLLENRGVTKSDNNKYLDKDYKSLIKQLIDVNVDGNNISCVIGNIIYEQNYYYNGLKEVLGDFISCAYYCPGNLSRESMYFFNNHSYQNSFFINYVNQTYNNKLYNVNVVRNNIIEAFDYTNVTDFYYKEYESNNVIYILLTVLSFLFLSIVVLINYLKCLTFNLKYIFLNCFAIVVPYTIFFLVSNITHSILLFSNAGILLFILLFIYYIGAHLILLLIIKLYNYHLKRKANICKR